MTTANRIRCVVALLVLAGMVAVWRHPGVFGTKAKADAVVIIEETANRSTLPVATLDVLRSTTLGPALKAKGVTLIGPLDKDVTGTIPANVAAALSKAKTEKLPRAVGMRGGSVVFDVELPTEAELVGKFR